MRIFGFLLRCSRRTLLLGTLAGIVSGAASTGLLGLMNAGLHVTGPGRTRILWAFAALCICVPLSRIVSNLLLVNMGQETTYDLRMRLSRRVLAVPLRHLEQLGAPRILAVLTGDIPTIANVVTAVPLLGVNLSVILGCLIYMGLLSWKVLAATLAFILLGVVSYQLPVHRAMTYFLRSLKVRDDLYRHFRALTEGSKELKLHSRRRAAFLDDVLSASATSYRRITITGQAIYTFAASWGQLLAFAVIGLVVFVGPQISPAAFDSRTTTGYALVLLYLLGPLQMVMDTMPVLGQADAALQRVEELGLELQRHATEALAAIAPEARPWQRLELRAVTHAYRREGEDREFTLGPIDLALAPGELVFVAGGNGSGKTTLSKILVGLYPPQTGEIRLDGERVTDANREVYRQYFSVVFSDFFLFETLLGLEPLDLDARARQYLSELQLAHKVTIEAGKLSTTELSQGQRKRLALLTAFLEDRPIYVFDEWAADQDPLFKDVFYLEILAELKRRGKAVVVISHDDRYYHVGDRIVRLESGKLLPEPGQGAPGASGAEYPR